MTTKVRFLQLIGIYIYITDSIGCSFKIKIAYLASDFLVLCREGLCKGT